MEKQFREYLMQAELQARSEEFQRGGTKVENSINS